MTARAGFPPRRARMLAKVFPLLGCVVLGCRLDYDLLSAESQATGGQLNDAAPIGAGGNPNIATGGTNMPVSDSGSFVGSGGLLGSAGASGGASAGGATGAGGATRAGGAAGAGRSSGCKVGVSCTCETLWG